MGEDVDKTRDQLLAEVVALRRRVGELAACVTVRAQSEHTQDSSEARYRAIFEMAPYPIVLVSREGVVTECNQRVKDVLGRTVTDMIGRSLLEIVHPDDADSMRSALETVLRQGFLRDHSCRMSHKDGETVDTLIHAAALRNGQEQYIRAICFIEDVTEQARLQQRLRQMQTLEAVGQLAGGVAHQFNNLLTVINGYGEMVMGALDPADPLREDVRAIHDAGQRAAELTQQLLAFGRRQMLRMRVLNLNEVIEGMSGSLSHLAGEGIVLKLELADPLGSVRADATQIREVIVHLVTNAGEAMRAKAATGGVVTIGTRNLTLDGPPSDRRLDLEVGPYVCLTISDTGVGMSSEVMQHLFEPFFTTKSWAEGTGLGLAAVYGIIKQLGGDIRVHSQPGQGTSFEMFLPCVQKAPEKRLDQPTGLPKRRETVLVVDSDEGVRRLAVRTLQHLGYTVVEAADGAEALNLCAELTGAPDLVLTAPAMPDIGGGELVARLREGWPGLKALYVSDQPVNAPERARRPEAEGAFLRKPFTIGQLAVQVRQALDPEVS